jgi:hypothetical protein
MTYRYVVYDIEKTLKKNFDYAYITLNQILYWVMGVANKIRLQHTLDTNTDMFTSTYCPVVIEEDEKGRKYIDIPASIMYLQNNAGVVSMSYNVDTNCCSGPAFAQTFFQAVNYGEVQHIYLDEYEKPTAKNPYFYRVGDKVNGVDVNRLYLLGLECVDVVDLEIAVKKSLIMEVLELGRFGMMIPEERVNVGDDESSLDNYRTPKVPTPEDYSQPQSE